MDVTTVRTAIADTISGVVGLTYSFVPDAPNPPCAIIYVNDIDYSHFSTFDGTLFSHFNIMLLSSSVAVQSGQELLDLWLSPGGSTSTSVVAALQADDTLDGLVDSLLVQECKRYGATSFTDGGTRYFFAELGVEVIA
jgi:hypothetical protein